MPSCWKFRVDPWATESIATYTELLLHSSSDRPDGLVIVDDNMVPPVTRVLEASGVRIPEDLEVVAHTNFPCPTPTYVPVTRLGYDVRELIRKCVEVIDAQRRGETPPPVTHLLPRFEHELPR